MDHLCLNVFRYSEGHPITQAKEKEKTKYWFKNNLEYKKKKIKAFSTMVYRHKVLVVETLNAQNEER